MPENSPDAQVGGEIWMRMAETWARCESWIGDA